MCANDLFHFCADKDSHFQNEHKCQSLLVKTSFNSMRIKKKFQSMALHLASLWNRGLVRLGGGPNLFICVLVMFLNCVFQQEQFNRFLWFLASVIKNGGTLTTCYFHFLVQKVSIISKSSDRFFPNFNNIFLKFHHFLLPLPKIIEIG